ncbi:MAG: transposase [Pseudomonadota bacterium]|uniref:transposase n=1 Tax=Polaromonas sp. TaxID=1869339 RepID=UPI00181FB744|nr:transposase [Polaromonas sp.]MBA3594773.1 transposase [Polaromonas sp.]MDQ3272840.1 transposase [Pseudomonadota bacterium]
MARLPRLSLPGYPQHIIQRGNNRQSIAACTADYQTLLALIDESARKFSVAIHAYVLMDNQFHLLVTPETAEGVPQLMQATGRRYVRYFNDSQGRSGTLWEGRYRSTVIQAERYLLACMAYLDLNPVHHGLVPQARDYPWSSHGHYAGLRVDRLVTPHPRYWSLGNTPFSREAAYEQIVKDGVPPDQQLALTQSALSGWALGDAAFVADLQTRTQRRVSKVAAGRPPRKPPAS